MKREDDPVRADSAPRHLIVTIHGIRTFGQWQERLERLLRAHDCSEEQLTIVHYKFGYFSAFAFLSILMRWIAVKRFRAELVALARAPWDKVDIVGHSFGTFIVAKALKSLRVSDKVHVDTLIVAGSVLPDYFRWKELVPNRITSVVNECGVKDNVLLLSQALPFLGMAGRVGFRGMTSKALRNRFFGFGHSGYFLEQGKPCDDFMRQYWLPILLEGAEAGAVEDPRNANPLACQHRNKTTALSPVLLLVQAIGGDAVSTL